MGCVRVCVCVCVCEREVGVCVCQGAQCSLAPPWIGGGSLLSRLALGVTMGGHRDLGVFVCISPCVYVCVCASWIQQLTEGGCQAPLPSSMSYPDMGQSVCLVTCLCHTCV